VKIKEVSTELFNKVIKTLLKEGAKKSFEYQGMDAWIDYGEVHLWLNEDKIVFTWTNWFEGEIEADPALLNKICSRFGIPYPAA